MGKDTIAGNGESSASPSRNNPPPAHLSDIARAALAAPRGKGRDYPAQADKASWRKLIAARDAASAATWATFETRLKADAVAITMGGVPVHVATPRDERLVDTRHVILDIHGGALLFGGGEANVRHHAKEAALRTGRVAYSLDYRVPPDHPYPAALDDCMAAYRGLLEDRTPQQIVISGVSAGGNLAAALLLRARDEGLPMPAGVILRTPELDLTESGDSFDTLIDLDTVLTGRLMAMNLLYADGANLAHPYLSPLFGDVSGFPPTWLQTGGRDAFLSNTVRMHRKLRNAGVRAELHVWEAMPHGGFGGASPEDREMNAEMKAFIATLA